MINAGAIINVNAYVEERFCIYEFRVFFVLRKRREVGFIADDPSIGKRNLFERQNR